MMTRCCVRLSEASFAEYRTQKNDDAHAEMDFTNHRRFTLAY